MSNGSSVTESVLYGLSWRNIGPHRGGRVVAVAGDVNDRETFYMGACAGGVWKTVDGGLAWRNVSDGYFTTAAIGALACSESDPNVLYAGTGEASIRGNVSHGDGVYKSTDGGKTWRNMGLRDTRHIGKIQIHPKNPDIVYVAALGHAFGPSEERGVFRSTDGGESWERVLYKSPRAGSHDVTMDLNNPRILYAAIWQVQRYPHTLINGGEESGIYRSMDGGDTWQEITRNPGLPAGILGKIGVAASRAKPGRVWALVEAEDGAMFRSDDYGATWTRLSEQALLRTRPWYYMHVTADPVDPDTVYVQNYSIWKSIDGGASFTKMPSPHGDEHALWIDPKDNQRMVEGNDGGAIVSFNGGGIWSSIYNQPTAQLYHVIADDQVPYRVYGSQQDNTAISVPSATTDAAIHERDWFIPGGGESGYIGIKPDEPWHIVASGPAGRHIYNDIMTHYDHRTGQVRNITVWPELYGWGVGAEVLKYRLQWTFPILFSRHAPHPLYVAGNVLFKSTDLGSSFEVISPDLTRNDPDKLKASGGPITRDNTGAEVYCTIFALAESPRRPEVLWAGTDDGLVHFSEDFGKTWTNVTPPDLPEWALISIIEVSPHEEGVVYVAATRYKLDDTKPYLFKTADNGKTWTAITGGIPDHEFTRVIREDPNRRGLLYAGTETGIYVSFDDGGTWRRLGGNFPVVPVHDFIIKGVELVVASHGRSFWILDDLTTIHQLADLPTNAGATLFAPRSRQRIRRYEGWGGDSDKAFVQYGQAGPSQIRYDPVDRPDGTTGEAWLDAGTNPPDGIAVFYHLTETPTDEITLTFLDESGNEIRTFSSAKEQQPPRVPKSAGLNCFVWNLREPGAEKATVEELQRWDRPDGAMVVPGSYQVRLTVAGESQTRSFAVEPDPRIETGQAALIEQRDMLREIIGTLSRTNQTLNSLDDLKKQVAYWQGRTGDQKVQALAKPVLDELDELAPRLIDVQMKGAQLWPSGLHEKLNALFDTVDGADYAPPKQTREVFGELNAELEEVIGWLRNLNAEGVAELRRAIEATGLPIVGIEA
ncbi:MAG: glycosyl hydrolase [Thermomicrobiales bacterium]|nr:glycosyl hydrolase [Thermomicrobiales bacterium]